MNLDKDAPPAIEALTPLFPSGAAVTRASLDPTPLLAKRRRGWELGLPTAAVAHGKAAPVIVAIGGGKGGVGKSLVSANLAVRLAATGRKVVAIDLDVGGANLHTYFGLATPRHTLADAIVYKTRTLPEILATTAIDGVRLAAGGREEVWGGAGALDRSVLGALFSAILALKEQGEADFVILDLGAGTHKHTLDFFNAAHLGLITVLAEPTSIENAYLFLKTSLFRLIENVGEKLGVPDTAEDVRSALILGDAEAKTRSGGYAERLRQIGATYPGFVSHLNAALAGRAVGIAVNQTRSQKDIDVGKSMELIAERYFGLTARSCGYLNYDEAAWKSLRNRRLLVVDFPHSLLSRRFSELARLILTNLGF
jgi:flagellar biosynthesis protein FlhG